jgi:hypothetical protein
VDPAEVLVGWGATGAFIEMKVAKQFVASGNVLRTNITEQEIFAPSLLTPVTIP